MSMAVSYAWLRVSNVATMRSLATGFLLVLNLNARDSADVRGNGFRIQGEGSQPCGDPPKAARINREPFRTTINPVDAGDLPPSKEHDPGRPCSRRVWRGESPRHVSAHAAAASDG